MGYTHYWTFGHFINERDYKRALQDIRKIVTSSPVPLANGFGKRGTNPVLNKGVVFNGVEDDSHETFYLGTVPVPDDALPPNPRFNFCRTARKPYDVIVTACLCVLSHYLGKGVDVTSDGEPHEWEAGRTLVQAVLRKGLPIPPLVRSLDGWREDYREEYLKAHPEYA